MKNINSLEDIQPIDEIVKYAAPNFLTQQPFLHTQYKLRDPHKCHQLFLRVPAKWLLGWQKCLSPQGHQVAPPPGSACFSVFWCVPTQCPTLGGTLASEVSVWCSCASGFGEADLRQTLLRDRKVSPGSGSHWAQRQTSPGSSLDPAATAPISLARWPRPALGSDHGKKWFLPSPHSCSHKMPCVFPVEHRDFSLLLVMIAVNTFCNGHQRPQHPCIMKRGHLAWEPAETRKP